MLPNRINTAIIIVTFNPDNRLMHALEVHKMISDTIIIVDNNSDNKNEWLNRLDNNFIIIQSLDNNGIGWALNKGIKKANELNKAFFITFDQDSIPLPNILDLYSFWMTENVAMIGTWFTEVAEPVRSIHPKRTLTIITSGCLHRLNAIEQIGLYNEELFIDGVDFEYAIRANNLGFTVLRSTEPLISHKLGNPIIKWGIKSANHTDIRKYYIARNNIILSKKFIRTNTKWILKKNMFFIFDMIKMLLIESNKRQKLKNVFIGIKDGIKHR